MRPVLVGTRRHGLVPDKFDRTPMPCVHSTMTTAFRDKQLCIQSHGSRLSASRWQGGTWGTTTERRCTTGSRRPRAPSCTRTGSGTSPAHYAPWLPGPLATHPPDQLRPAGVATTPSEPYYNRAHYQLSDIIMQHKLRLVPARKRTLKPYKRSAIRPTSGAAHAAMPPAPAPTGNLVRSSLWRQHAMWCGSFQQRHDAKASPAPHPRTICRRRTQCCAAPRASHPP